MPCCAADTRDVVEAISATFMENLGFDEIKICCKSRPGMLLEAAGEHDITLQGSFMFGDRWRNIGAGKVARCTTIFIDRGYREQAPEKQGHVAGSLAEAAKWIVSLDE